MNRYAQRIEKLRASFAENGIDALFLNSNANVSYFTGKKGNDCSLYIPPVEAWIITDFWYEELAQSLNGWLSFYETAA
ncbi:MAG: aminopeptidase P family N-terminal domain-containing protein, partial [Firmicutes bacterium]|nr:aminopeptidase P family N-terminal domain-containing protein [Bacillota bacterium]